MATVNDIFQIALKMSDTASGKHGFCVFHYRLSALGTNPNNSLVQRFKEVVIPPLLNVLRLNAYVSAMNERNLFVATEFVDQTYVAATYPGTRVGTPLPVIVAAGFKAPRGRTDMRAGFKRVPFQSEADTDGEIWNSAYEDELNAFAVALSSNLTLGGNTWIPVTVKRIKYTTDEGKTAYRLPKTQAEAVSVQAIFAPILQVTNQVSRKQT